MDKILTISIAAYNVGEFLDKAITSCISEDCIDKVEILVMNDGSSDNTPEIADKYVKKYPGSVQLVNKENGGYGTTVNMALKLAHGKYFRLLDGDDWLDEGVISRYIKLLEETEADMVITNVLNCVDDSRELLQIEWSKDDIFRKIIGINDCKYLISMWHIAMKTDKLRKTWKNLPSHTLYTDQLFVYYSLLAAESLWFEEFPVYCYRIGREGQSIADDSRMKHWKDLCRVYKIMLRDYVTRENLPQNVDKRVETIYAQVIKTFLLFEPEAAWYRRIRKYEKELKETSGKIYNNMWWNYKRITILRLTGYTAYRLLAGRKKFGY